MVKFLVVLIITACSSYFPPIRGQYLLTSYKHFMISNMYVNPANLENQKTQFLINYDLIVKNIDTRAHAVDLKKSFIKITDKTFPMNCVRYQKHDDEFSMEPNEQARIICLATIPKNQFRQSDYQSIIEIPLDDDKARFEYLLRAEDFK